MSFSGSFSDNNRQNPSHFSLYALRQKFHQLFPHGWDFIEKETPESDWKTIKKYKLTEQKCWYKYIDPEKILGLRFGTKTRHGLCDIDLGSVHDPREQEKSLDKLKEELEKWGITRIFFVQSSFNYGLHFYFFFDRLINTFRLACVLNKVIEDAGLEIKRGQLETFPNTKRYNSLFNGHRLPLQQGSYLLDKDYVPYSDRLEDFISAAEWSAEGNDTDLLESRLEEAYDWFKVKKNTERVYNPTPEDKEFVEQVEYAQREIKEGFLNKIRLEVEQGFTGNGETNDLLLTIAKLGRILYGLSGQQYIDYIKETVTSCPGYVKYCRHKHEIDRRCAEVARCGEKKWFPYCTRLRADRPTYKYIKNSLTNQTNLNFERQHNAQSRIIQAVEYIQQEQGGLPNKVGECKLKIRNVTKELFGVSVSDATLKKPENLPLWHPKHRDEPTPAPHTEQSPEIVVIDIQAEEIEASDTTEAARPVEDIAESSNPENNTIELKKELAIPDTLDVSQNAEAENIIQLPLQAKPNSDGQHSQQSRPLNVVSKNQSKSKHLKAIPSLDPKKTVHTLAYMKGVMPAILLEFIYQVFQCAYYNALMRIPRLELVYQGYEGRGTGGLVQRKGEKHSQLQSIPPNTEVVILRKDYHSSSIRENPNQLLVYIKPLQNSQDWLNGIAVLIEHLIPIRSGEKISSSHKNTKNEGNISKSSLMNDKSSSYPKIPKRDEKSP
ncbi:MAG: hypothetical protein QNJ72_21970 [Pleurocapsa sp. MO_226.B13]|nr:hypothetical protein [Pleurocapsa sp. MO_226.B13]